MYKVQQWQQPAEEASYGRYSEDLDILNPELYEENLKRIADNVVQYSEFRRCRGMYNVLDDCTWDLNIVPIGTFEGIPDWIFTYMDNTNVGLDPSPDPNESVEAVKASLWKTCLMLSEVKSRLRELEETGFLQSSFNLLLRNTNKALVAVLNNGALGAAEITRIRIDDVDHILQGTVDSLQVIYERGELVDSDYILRNKLDELVWVPCHQILRQLSWPANQYLLSNDPPIDVILAIARMTAILLDLALISYTGSHGCRFDDEHLGQKIGTFEVHPGSYLPGFRCSLRRLACLDGFLDKCPVWVFEFQTRHQVWKNDSSTAGLPVLTRMDDFADIWGPVYEIPGRFRHDGSRGIKQYNVSNGIICRESGVKPIAFNGGSVIKCHWHDESSWLKGVRRKYLPPSENLWPEDLLLIGGLMVVQTTCSYTLDEYLNDYGGCMMNGLGTRPTKWKWDTITYAGGFSEKVTASVSGTRKRCPKTTVKERIIDKWIGDKTDATELRDPETLNRHYGVEVSHCTGNAQRVALKTLLTLSPMIERIDTQFAGWRDSDWGSEFWSAITSSDDSMIRKVWDRFQQNRDKMTNIVAFALDFLAPTGLYGSQFHVAFLHRGREQSVELKTSLNNWARLLKDNGSTACFAMVSNRCLGCDLPRTTTCSQWQSSSGLKARTTLQSRLTIHRSNQPELGSWGSIRVRPVGQLFDRILSRPGMVLLKAPTRLDTIVERLTGWGNEVIGVTGGVEAIDPNWGSGDVVAYVQATQDSHGGMTDTRKQLPTGKQRTFEEDFGALSIRSEATGSSMETAYDPAEAQVSLSSSSGGHDATVYGSSSYSQQYEDSEYGSYLQDPVASSSGGHDAPVYDSSSSWQQHEDSEYGWAI